MTYKFHYILLIVLLMIASAYAQDDIIELYRARFAQNQEEKWTSI